MAQGDVVFFDNMLLDLCEKQHDLENDDIRLALVDSTTALTVDLAIPHWGGTGTTDLSANQVAITAAYTGPVSLANPSVVNNSGVIEIDWDDPAAWASNASGDTDCKWAVIYNNTLTNKHCIGYVDLGTAFDMTSGSLTITFGTPAATLNQA